MPCTGVAFYGTLTYLGTVTTVTVTAATYNNIQFGQLLDFLQMYLG